MALSLFISIVVCFQVGLDGIQHLRAQKLTVTMPVPHDIKTDACDSASRDIMRSLGLGPDSPAP